MTSDPQALLRRLPKVDQLLDGDRGRALADHHTRDALLGAVRAELDRLRSRILAGDGVDEATLAPESVLAVAAAGLDRLRRPGLCRVINATGVVLHTGLGRAPLAPAACEAIAQAARGYSLLEVDRESGERGTRETAVTRLLCHLTGAEAATVVNNNAAATLIILAAVARGREVVCSRGQLVEIGGSFRIPDVMAESGATLVEVGATNKTHRRDYERAIGPETAALLRVHTSNFRIEGFSAEVPLAELVALGREHDVAVIDDLGSGAFYPLSPYGLPDEPLVGEALATGADLVCCSGDKLLGGPQAGLILGRADLVAAIRRHPLFRAMRPDKLILAGLEATLQLYLDPEELRSRLPTLRSLSEPLAELTVRAETLAVALRRAAPTLEVQTSDDVSQPGSGSLPTVRIPTHVVRIKAPGVTATELARRLRVGDPCVFTRVHRDAVQLDPRTLLGSELAEVVDGVRAAIDHHDR